jgi:biopolymer transport protein TolQ
MTPLLMLQAATTQALPEDAPAQTVQIADQAAAASATAASSAGHLDLLQLVLHASIPVQLVMLLLLFASIASWLILFRKKRVLDRAEKESERFEERFWSGAELAKLYAGATERGRGAEGMEAIFEAGFREFNRILEFLANVGSISPYVGLFGTVWGIMISFQGLANVKEATIATVAPGISEALIATAMGLFAAIPAVIAYNRYADQVSRIELRYDTFVEELSTILQRHASERRGGQTVAEAHA